MTNFIDITGKTYGQLTVLERTEYTGTAKKKPTLWKCSCSCGAETIVNGRDLKNGHTKSCGCYSKKRSKERRITHNGTYTRAYSIWCSMKARCYNPNSASFPYYGAKNIKVCDRWKHSFKNFIDDMGEPKAKQSIDRVNNSGDYSPDNCRWADITTQNNNRGVYNIYATLGNTTKTISEWCKIFGISEKAVFSRIYHHNDTPEFALRCGL